MASLSGHSLFMGKHSLIDKVYNKTGKTINKLLIEDIVVETVEYIKEKIIEDGVFSINNFGTFSVKYKNNKLRFIPHIFLLRLLKNKRDRGARKN